MFNISQTVCKYVSNRIINFNRQYCLSRMYTTEPQCPGKHFQPDISFKYFKTIVSNILLL